MTDHPRDWDKDGDVFAGLSEPLVRHPEKTRTKKETNWFKVYCDARQQYDRVTVLWQEGKVGIDQKQAALRLLELAAEQWLDVLIERVVRRLLDDAEFTEIREIRRVCPDD